MAAPTNTALVKKALANSEPSTHGPLRRFAVTQNFGRFRSEADTEPPLPEGIYTYNVLAVRGTEPAAGTITPSKKQSRRPRSSLPLVVTKRRVAADHNTIRRLRVVLGARSW